MPKQDQKLKLKRTVDSDIVKPVAPSIVTGGKYSIDNPGYRGSRIKIKLKNPKGYSGKEQ